ncbi:MAG TPA: TolC family protein [Ramlibacter sp.]|nr:TolC family protein [Ramlibacter sp.]
MKATLLALSIAAGLASAAPAAAQSPGAPATDPPPGSGRDDTVRLRAAPSLAGGVPPAGESARAGERLLRDAAAAAPPLTGEVSLSPRQLAQLVAARSPEVRYTRMGVDVAGYLSQAEASLYEAVLFSTLRGTDTLRQRTVEERLAATPALGVLDERNRSLEAGLRQRLPTAGELSLAYRIVRRENNIISNTSGGRIDTEWTGALVLTVKQPLLRNRGRDVLETDRKVAELEHQVQWAQLRQQVLKATADSLNLFWQLQRAQEARQLREDSLRNMQRIASEVEARIQGGRAPSSNMIEVRSSVLSRESDVTRAEQAVRETESRVLTALALSAATHPGVRLRAVQEPLPGTGQLEPVDKALDRALTLWPPYLISRLRLEQGRLRLNYAENQRKPALDLTASYTGTGYSNFRAEARHLATADRYPEWTVALNFEMPLGGGKADNQYDAQVVRVAQNELELEAIRTSLGNDLAQRRDEYEATLRLVEQMEQDQQLRQRLVETERERYNLGVGQLSNWLQRENELLEARHRLGEARMRAQMARVAWLFAQGSLLDEYDIALRKE